MVTWRIPAGATALGAGIWVDNGAALVGHQRGLIKFAYLMTGRTDAAEDVVAEVFARAWPALSRQTLRDPGAYLRRAVVNEVIRRARRERRERLRPLDRSRLDVPFDISHAERDRLLQGLAELTARQRAVLVLRFWEDLPEREVAELLGISLGSVKTHARRGLQRLRDLLGDEHED